MPLFRFVKDPPPVLEAPFLVTAFDGWVDAAGAATGAAEHLAREGEPLAVFDSDALYDYRARRPTLELIDGQVKDLQWPELAARHVRAGGRDLVVLSGPEPDYRWHEFASSVHELVLRLGVIRSIGLGALPAAVPHTRPTPILATASRRELLTPEDRVPEGLLRVPAAALSVMQYHLHLNGIPTVGFFAQAPHYVTPTYTPAVLALVERVGRHLEVSLPLGALIDEATRQRAQLDDIVSQRPEVKEHIERLEALAAEGGLVPGERIPTGDEIAAEIERFLRDSPGE